MEEAATKEIEDTADLCKNHVGSNVEVNLRDGGRGDCLMPWRKETHAQSRRTRKVKVKGFSLLTSRVIYRLRTATSQAENAERACLVSFPAHIFY